MSAQSDFPFPWNPDSDSDGWVSTEDLLSLLSVFDTQFDPEQWETDSLNAAVVLDGTHGYFACQNQCHQIEGHWRMADLDAIGRHYNLVSADANLFWINSNEMLNKTTNVSWGSWGYHLYGASGQLGRFDENEFSIGKKCLCYIKAIPANPVNTTQAVSIASLQDSINTLKEQIQEIQDLLDSSEFNETISLPVEPPKLTCVEMGLSPLCPQGLGWSDFAVLTPTDNYTYSIANTQSTNNDNLIDAPLWRKFAITGVALEHDSVNIKISHYRDGIYSDNQTIIATTTLEPVIEGDTLFFWVYGRRFNCEQYGGEPCCEEEGLPLVIPLESSLCVEYNYIAGTNFSGYDGLGIWIEQHGSYRDTGLRFNTQ